MKDKRRTDESKGVNESHAESSEPHSWPKAKTAQSGEEVAGVSDAFSRSILDAMPACIGSLDLRGYYTSWNEAAEQMLGYKTADVVGKRGPHDFAAEPAQGAQISHSVQRSGSFRGDVMLRHQTGKTFPAYLIINRQCGKDDAITGMIALVIDTSELKQTEETLRRTEQEKAVILNAMSEHVVFHSPELKILWANRAAAASVNTTPAHLIGRHCYEIWHQRTTPCSRCPVEKARQTGKPQHSEITSPDGRVWFIRGYPVHDENQNLIGIVELTLETTERKRAEKALQESELQYRTTLDSMGDAIHVVDSQLRLLLFNRAFREWNRSLGLSTEILGKTVFEAFPFLSERVREEYRQVFSTGKILLSEESTKIGEEEFITETRKIPVKENGEVVQVVTVVRNITEKRKLEADLLKAQKLESIGILAGGIAHDFNNLLAAIWGYITLAKMHARPGDNVFEELKEAEKACARAKNLTQQLLTFSKGGALVKKVVEVAQLVKESTAFVCHGSRVECQFSFPEHLWPVELDSAQLSQVFQNLVLNAQQAMPDGGRITISGENLVVNAEEKSPLRPGKYVKIIIKDEGAGIPEEHLGKIFDPFFTTKQKGSGLGLAISYSILKSHKGFIRVESEVGIGTTVDVFLPAFAEEWSTREQRKEKPLPARGKIVVMEEEKMVREVAKQMLKALGYEVTLADDTREVIEHVQKSKDSGVVYDAVILDIAVSGEPALGKTVEKLREVDPHLKIIASGHYSTAAMLNEFKKLGFSDIMVKPYSIGDMSSMLRKVIETSQD